MKNMLSKEDLSQIQEMLNSGFDAFDTKAVQPLRNAIGNLKVEMEELELKVDVKITSSTNKILNRIDEYTKKNETLETEQAAHKSQLDRHSMWIKKADKKLKIGIAE